MTSPVAGCDGEVRVGGVDDLVLVPERAPPDVAARAARCVQPLLPGKQTTVLKRWCFE